MNIDWRTLIRFYRAPLFLNFYIFLIGINIYGWRRNGVNHVLIFELNPRDHLGEQHLMEISAFLSCAWGWSLIVMLSSKSLGIPVYSSPLALFVFYIVFLFNPIAIFWSSARFWLIRRIVSDLRTFFKNLHLQFNLFLLSQFRILTMPFHKVKFADFWLADQFASLTPIFLDLQYAICFYFYSDNVFDLQVATSKECLSSCHCNNPTFFIRPLIRCIPGWLRLIQCFRRCRDTEDPNQIHDHLTNALKYATTFLVIIFSTLHASYKGEDNWILNIFYSISVWLGFQLVFCF